MAQNVCAHVPSPWLFLSTAKRQLKKDGTIFVQTSQKDMFQKGEFDTVYHEHVSYFSIKSMQALANRSGLKLVSVEERDIHGGSYLFKLKKEDYHMEMHEAALLNACMRWEEEQGRNSIDLYEKFSGKVLNSVVDFSIKIKVFRQMGLKIIGFGAAAKAMTYLNASGVKLDWIVDENPLKIGRYTPGSNIPIKGIETLDVEDGIVVVVLAWNFFEEIKAKVLKIREKREEWLTSFYRY